MKNDARWAEVRIIPNEYRGKPEDNLTPREQALVSGKTLFTPNRINISGTFAARMRAHGLKIRQRAVEYRGEAGFAVWAEKHRGH